MKKKIFILSIYTLGIVTFAYADIYSDGINQVKEIINNQSGSLYNTNSPKANELKGSIDGWLKNADSNLNALMGDENKELKTVGTGENVDISRKCVASQKKIAELNISDGAPVNINLSLFSNNGLGTIFTSIEVKNITGVCPDKFMVCDEAENRRLCDLTYNYTNFGNENREIPGLGNTEKDNMTREQIKSHACYRLTKCMNWQFTTKEVNDSLKLLVLGNAAGRCDNVLNKTGITVSQKDMFISQVKGVISEVTAEGLSSVSSDEKNSKTEYFALSTSDCSNDNYSTGMTDMNDLLKYYNKSPDELIKDQSNIKNNYGGTGTMYDKVSNAQSVKDNPFDKDTASSINKGFENMGNSILGINIPKECYTPVCTIDVTETKTVTNTDGTVVEHIKQSRIFRDCVASGYTETGGLKKTIYKCPANGVTEIPQQQKDKSICTCNNEHQLAENLKKATIATSMAEAIYNSACGKKDEEDNKTMSQINDRRQECLGKTGSDYEACMNRLLPN